MAKAMESLKQVSEMIFFMFWKEPLKNQKIILAIIYWALSIGKYGYKEEVNIIGFFLYYRL